MSDNNKVSSNKLTLYFIFILGIIAVFVWTMIFIQIFHIVNDLTTQLQRSNQTQSIINQTQLLLYEDVARERQTQHEDIARENQTLHEDIARENQILHEDIARFNQTELILNQVKAITKEHHEQIKELINNNTINK